MCQLIFINGGEPALNRMMAVELMYTDTATKNKDGTGLFSTYKGKVLKQPTNAREIQNLGQMVRNNVGSDPVMIHVRQASTGTVMKLENTHPFEDECFVLAHNGTLLQKEKDPAYNGVLDSEIFLKELTKTYKVIQVDKRKDKVVESLIETMKSFCGKFAFLIYCKETKIWYAVRGKTADLSASFFSDNSFESKEAPPIKGYVINTVNDDLQEVAVKMEELYPATVGKSLYISNPRDLSEETIFRLDILPPEIRAVGQIKENPYPERPKNAVYPATAGGWRGGYAWQGGGWQGGGWGEDWEGEDDSLPAAPKAPGAVVTAPPVNTVEGDFTKVATKIASWLDEFGLKPEDLDVICYAVFGDYLLNADLTTLATLHTFVLEEMTAPKKIKKFMRKAYRDLGSSIIRELHLSNDLQFPYMLLTASEQQKLAGACLERKKTLDAQNNKG